MAGRKLDGTAAQTRSGQDVLAESPFGEDGAEIPFGLIRPDETAPRRRGKREPTFVQPTVEGPGFGPSRIVPPPFALDIGESHGLDPSTLRRGVAGSAPVRPGVYGMFDEYGRVLYIGQSKQLRTRLLSYFRDSPGDGGKARRLIARTVKIRWEPVAGEFAALLRELELIQRLRPRFNVQGQPGRVRRAFVCLAKGPAPYLFLSPTPVATAQEGFGPLWHTWRIVEAVRILNDWFRLRDCSDRVPLHFAEQKRMFPIEQTPGCLRYELNQCLGPCVGACTKGEYDRRCRDAKAFLRGLDNRPADEMLAKMQAAAAAKAYELAATWRDRWERVAELLRGLERIREARSRFAFVYPSATGDGPTWWHVLSGGQVEATCAAPTDAASAEVARRTLEGVYARSARRVEPQLLESFDMVLLTSRWFHQRPEELLRVRSPEDALLHCRPADVASCPIAPLQSVAEPGPSKESARF